MEGSASALSFSPPLASLRSPPCTPRPPTLTLAISRFGGGVRRAREWVGGRAWCRDLRAQPPVVELLPHRSPFPLPLASQGAPSPLGPAPSCQKPTPLPGLPHRWRLRWCQPRMKCVPKSYYRGVVGWQCQGQGRGPAPGFPVCPGSKSPHGGDGFFLMTDGPWLGCWSSVPQRGRPPVWRCDLFPGHSPRVRGEWRQSAARPPQAMGPGATAPVVGGQALF